MAVVYLGLGSNLGDRAAYIRKALEGLKARGVHVIKISSILETEPEGGPPQGKYFNAVVECSTTVDPLSLLKMIHDIEHDLGRVRTVPNAPRTIDLDILLYDQIHLNTPELTIPHPRMNSRDFVTEPLKEIAPHLFKEK